MGLTGWYSALIMTAMCFMYLAGVVMGCVLLYLFMIFRGARTYIKSKKRMDEALENLEEKVSA